MLLLLSQRPNLPMLSGWRVSGAKCPSHRPQPWCLGSCHCNTHLFALLFQHIPKTRPATSAPSRTLDLDLDLDLHAAEAKALALQIWWRFIRRAWEKNRVERRKTHNKDFRCCIIKMLHQPHFRRKDVVSISDVVSMTFQNAKGLGGSSWFRTQRTNCWS